jgi:hypothetical protein
MTRMTFRHAAALGWVGWYLSIFVQRVSPCSC